MRILVCGGRDFKDKEFLYRKLDLINRKHVVDAIIEGDARGADRMAGYWARKNRVDNIKFKADWKSFGAAAGHIRNAKMLKYGRPDVVVAFPGGAGTRDMILKAENAGILVWDLSQ